MNAILAIDQGTHASHALHFDQHGTILANSNKPISIAQKVHGVIEQDGAAALSTQRSTLVAWNSRTGKPLATVIY